MAGLYEFDLVFALPEGEHDAFELSDAAYSAGFAEAVVGTGSPGCVAVALELEGDNAHDVILDAARKLLKQLPEGSSLREVRPDLVSLADVARKLSIRRQALQKRRMPVPAAVGYYRITEVEEALAAGAGLQRRARFDIDSAMAWFAAGKGAQRVNAQMALGVLDPTSLELHAQAGSLPAGR